MAASIVIKDEAKKRRARSIGLIPEHSYGLLSAAEIVDKAGKKVQLVKLRNPWGTFEWRGDYSGNSDCWTEEQREELEVSEEKTSRPTSRPTGLLFKQSRSGHLGQHHFMVLLDRLHAAPIRFKRHLLQSHRKI